MVLKDWKKMRNHKYVIEFHNLKKSEILAIFGAHDPIVWSVHVGKSFYGTGLEQKFSAKNKSKALAFAKAYMIKN